MAGFSTPLLDFFKRGDVERDLRLLAAQGSLASRAHEQLGLLMLLTADRDAEVASTAEATLNAIPVESLGHTLAGSDVSAETRAFFAARGVEPAPNPDSDAMDADATLLPDAADGATEGEKEDESTTLQRIAAMTVAQRVVAAMKGTREERAILIRDPNKMVTVAVLSSPKLTETEVESIARMTSVSEEALRIIGRTRAWMKNYAVMAGLAKNPKTPVALSMNLLARLTDKDLKMISTDRNVPDVVRQTARRKMAAGG
jgi:hypothetical protein